MASRSDDLACDFDTIDRQLEEGREMSNVTALAKPAAAAVTVSSIRIESLDEVWRLAESLAQARGFIPSGLLGNPGGIAAAILTGIELGMGPMEAIRSIHVVEGKPTLAADLMLARAIRAGVRHTWEQADANEARLRLERTGFTPYVQRWTLADAKAAGLAGKGNWSKYGAAMLRARCVSAAMRAFCPDVLGSGVYVEGEIEGESATAGASSGSPEVRDLGAAVHESGEPAEGPDPMAAAMGLLATLKSDEDLWSWIAAWGAKYTREPDSTRKREQWKAITAAGKRVTPPMMVAEVKEAFRLGGKRPKPAADVVNGETDDGEVLPGVRAMEELSQCETREMMQAWCEDNREYLASIPHGTPAERVTWIAIRRRATEIGDVTIADDLEARLS